MPVCEHKCGKCGAVIEFLEGISGKKKHVCQKCGSGDMEKQFSTFAVGVKQDGTDSKSMGCTDRGCPYSGM